MCARYFWQKGPVKPGAVAVAVAVAVATYLLQAVCMLQKYDNVIWTWDDLNAKRALVARDNGCERGGGLLDTICMP